MRATAAAIAIAVAQVAAGAPTFSIVDSVMPGNTPADALNLKVLQNTATGEYVKIIRDFGGRLEDLTLRSKSGAAALKQVIATHNNNASAVRANVHWAGAMLAPFANRIANGTYTFEGTTHYLPRNEVRCGGECDCALHGFLWNKNMTVLAQVVNDDEATLSLGYDFDGTDPGYPFQPSMVINYTLNARGLDVTVRVENPCKENALPFFHSVHPYFATEDVSQCIVEFDNCTGWNHMDMGPG
jgi:galactose mutarotase-like enzyme